MLFSGVQSGNGLVVIPYEPTLCSPGTYSTNGYLPCTTAPAGYYDAGPGNTTATPCAQGTYSATAGRAACTPADPGYFVPGSGSSAETICPAGTYTGTQGNTGCTLAPVGSYDPGTGNPQALLCGPGTFSSAPGSPTCTPASEGPGPRHRQYCGHPVPGWDVRRSQGNADCTPAPAGSYDLLPGTLSHALPHGELQLCRRRHELDTCTPAPAGYQTQGRATLRQPFAPRAPTAPALAASLARTLLRVTTTQGRPTPRRRPAAGDLRFSRPAAPVAPPPPQAITTQARATPTPRRARPDNHAAGASACTAAPIPQLQRLHEVGVSSSFAPTATLSAAFLPV